MTIQEASTKLYELLGGPHKLPSWLVTISTNEQKGIITLGVTSLPKALACVNQLVTDGVFEGFSVQFRRTERIAI